MGSRPASTRLLVDVEETLLDDFKREVLLELLVIHLVPSLLQLLTVVGPVPRADLGVGRAVVLLQLGERGEVLCQQRLERGPQIAQEALDPLGALGHPDLRDELRVGHVAHELGLRVPQRDELFEDLRVLLLAPRVEGRLDLLARGLDLAPLHQRHHARVLEAHLVLAVGLLALCQPVLGHALERGRRQQERRVLLAQVLLKLDAEARDLGVNHLDLGGGLLVQVQPHAPEVAQPMLEVAGPLAGEALGVLRLRVREHRAVQVGPRVGLDVVLGEGSVSLGGRVAKRL